jgi:hypothetical protein
MKIISKAEAKKQGLKTYYTGKPCPRGHDAPRFVTGKCIECNRERNKLRPKKTGNAKTGEVLPPSDWRGYATKIAAAWRKTTESVLETGRLLNEAKAKVEHGDWLTLCQVLPFGEDTAQRLMAIARHPVISNTEHVRYLPPSWGTLYQLTKVSDKALIAGIEDHSIHPGMERKEAAALLGPGAPRKRHNKPSTGETFKGMAEEIEHHKAHIAELEAARVSGLNIDEDDEATMASKIIMAIGKGRAAVLVLELEKLINPREEPDSEAKLH